MTPKHVIVLLCVCVCVCVCMFCVAFWCVYLCGWVCLITQVIFLLWQSTMILLIGQQHQPLSFMFSFYLPPTQAHLLLPWRRDDGGAMAAVQSSLLDLDKQPGRVWQGQNSNTAYCPATVQCVLKCLECGRMLAWGWRVCGLVMM